MKNKLTRAEAKKIRRRKAMHNSFGDSLVIRVKSGLPRYIDEGGYDFLMDENISDLVNSK